MAVFSGTAGSVVIIVSGTAAVQGINEWSLDIQSPTVEVTEFGQTWDQFVPSVRNWTGSFSGNKHNAVNSVDNSVLGGSVVTVQFYESATKYWAGSAYITGMSPSLSLKGKGDITYNIQGHGAITYN